eukprot:scaffold13458_cov75-Phaeocystis_antarctica.AAC.2
MVGPCGPTAERPQPSTTGSSASALRSGGCSLAGSSMAPRARVVSGSADRSTMARETCIEARHEFKHERAAASGDQQLIQREHLSTEQRDENLGALVVNDRRGVPQSEEQRGERSIARRTLGLRSIVRGWCALRRCASAKGSRRVLLHEWRTPCRKCRTAHGGDGAALGGQGVGVCGSKQNAAEERSDRLHAQVLQGGLKNGGQNDDGTALHFLSNYSKGIRGISAPDVHRVNLALDLLSQQRGRQQEGVEIVLELLDRGGADDHGAVRHEGPRAAPQDRELGRGESRPLGDGGVGLGCLEGGRLGVLGVPARHVVVKLDEAGVVRRRRARRGAVLAREQPAAQHRPRHEPLLIVPAEQRVGVLYGGGRWHPQLLRNAHPLAHAVRALVAQAVGAYLALVQQLLERRRGLLDRHRVAALAVVPVDSLPKKRHVSVRPVQLV